MYITKAIIQNYRCLRHSITKFNSHLNVIVGNNECGKSTALEAIHLVLSGYINSRSIQTELHPHLFNLEVVREFIDNLQAGRPAQPPHILIELYFADHNDLAHLKGTNNSGKENCPGVKMLIEFDENYAEEYNAYVADPSAIRTLPVEYYAVRWRGFSDSDITSRSIPIKPSLIDASTIRNNAATSRYVVDIMKDSLSRKQQVDLALSYRLLKDKFLQESRVEAINKALESKKGPISNKKLTVSLDTSSRNSWEAGVMPQLDDVPIPLVGKGEQNSVKIKLALETSSESHLVLIEEPENHLSHSNLNTLIEHISAQRGERQLIITTHSSFVLNKLGVESVMLFGRTKSITLKDLTSETQDYFMKLPGHDTLRLILADRAILVEGPSDELIVQSSFVRLHGAMPLDRGVDVISVSSLAFKRFLEIALLLDRRVHVVTDNDGDLDALKRKYANFLGKPGISICYDEDIAARTLEPQLLKANSLAKINAILGKNFTTEEAMLKFMSSNKTEVALAFFKTTEVWVTPKYIEAAIG